MLDEDVALLTILHQGDYNKYVDQTTKDNTAKEITVHVEAAARELSLERFANYENELYQRILAKVSSSSMEEQVGGILAIKYLVNNLLSLFSN